MRPAKRTQLNRGETEASNRFACLQTSEDESLSGQSALNHEPMIGKSAVNRWKPKFAPKPSIQEDRAQSISEVCRNTNREIASVSQTAGQWERIAVKIDSGAVDTVMPPHVATHFNLEHTEMSKSGPGFKAANGSQIKYFGPRSIRGVGDQHQLLNMTAQVAEVKSTLGSVHQMVRAGNRVHSESGNCYIEHVATGRRTPMMEKGGAFEGGLWAPKSSESGGVQQVSPDKPPSIPTPVHKRTAQQVQDVDF